MNHIKGKVTDIFKSMEKNDPQYGKSAQLKITIEGGAEYNLFYNYGKEGYQKPEPVVVGDEVEFDWERNEKFGSKDIINKKDNYTFKNLTNPNAVPEKKGFNGGGFKADPAQQARQQRSYAINQAIEILKHNLVGAKISVEQVKDLTKIFEGFVYEAKALGGSSNPTDAPNADIEPIKSHHDESSSVY